MTLCGCLKSIAVALILAGCAAREAAHAVFTLDQCARVPLIDETTGAAIVGAEDLDIDREAGRIFVSAYDRRKAERAADRRARSIPEGGVFSIAIEALDAGQDAVKVRSLVDPAAIEGGLRPQGVTYDPSVGALIFINRGYARERRSWRMEPRLVALDSAGNASRAKSSVECSANDLALSGGRLLVTLDHGGCGWRIAFEDVFGTRGGRLVDDNGVALVSGLGFANGVVAAPDGALAVAATRERAVHLVSMVDGQAEITSTVRTGAAPDNLTLSDDGGVVAALHPSLFSLGLQRKLGIGRSPSRIVEIDLQSGGQRLLFDDPKASLISAATVALSTQGVLIIGSVMDSGLVVCRSGGAES